MIVVRSILFNTFFVGTTFVMTVAATLARMVARDRVMDLAVVWARILVAAARILCGIRLEVVGLEHIPPGAALIASRHQSAFDTFVWLTLVPRCCYVFKRELLRIPLFGPLVTAAGMIAVDRDGGSVALRGLLRETDRAVREQRQVIIFPEGTRGEPGRLLPLQPGIAAMASHTGLPVIPVATDSGHCWGRRAFRKIPGTIRIVIGSAIPAKTSRVALMAAVADGLGEIDASEPNDPDKSGDNSVQSSRSTLVVGARISS